MRFFIDSAFGPTDVVWRCSVDGHFGVRNSNDAPWFPSEDFRLGGRYIATKVEVSEDEAFGNGWRADLAKPTTAADCAVATRRWAESRYHKTMGFSAYLMMTRYDEREGIQTKLRCDNDAELISGHLERKVAEHTQRRVKPVEVCPIENAALWNITPPLQRKALLETIYRQKKASIDEHDKRRLCLVEHRMVNGTLKPVNKDEYAYLTGIGFQGPSR